MNDIQHSPFKNDGLVDVWGTFVALVDERIIALRAQATVSGALLRDKVQAKALQAEALEALVEGVCADFIHEIGQLSDATMLGQRNLGSELILELRYVMAAWADEALIGALHEQMPKRQIGAIEQFLFGSMEAGEKIFTKIERILARRSAGESSLAVVYLLLLTMGFRGQYSSQPGAAKLVQYQRALANLTLLAPGVPAPVPGPSRHSMPTTLLRTKYRWLLWLTGLLWLLALIGVDSTWHAITGPLRQAMTQLDTPLAGRMTREAKP